MNYNTGISGADNSYTSYLAGGGEMGNLFRSFDWSSASLGTPDTWPQSLLIIIGVLLNTRFAMILFWGDEYLQFYNDAYRQSFGDGGIHPAAFGRPGKDTWQDRWTIIKAKIDHVMSAGEPTWSDNEEVLLYRKGKTEKTYWTYSYGQTKGDDGRAQGAFVICHETTQAISNASQIQELNEELTAANEELASSNEEMVITNEDLSETQNHLQKMMVELAEKESKFRTLVEQIPVAINVFETRDLIVSLPNDKMLEIWGRRAEQMNGKPLLAAMPELEGQPFMNRLYEVLATGQAYYSTEERAFILRKGILTECFFNIIYQPLADADGNINSILQIASEVTDAVFDRKKIQDLNEELATINEELRKANEEMRKIQSNLMETNSKLSESEEKLRLANEAAGIGNWVVDGSTGKMISTRLYREIFGLDPNKETSLAEVASLMHESYVEKAKQAGELAIRERKSYVNEYPFRRRSDGAFRWIRTIATPKFDEKGNLLLFTGVTMDITDSVVHRQKIEESEERFRTMAEGTLVMIGVRNESNNPVYYNKAWENFSGRSQQTLLKAGWTDLLYPEDRERFLDLFEKASISRASFNSEFRVLNSENNYRWLLINLSSSFRHDGSFAGYISSSIDITEQKRDEERKNDFIGMVSHELKTPLTSLTGYIELVSYGLKKYNDTKSINLLEKANRQVGKMTNMINGFLNVSRLESGKLHIGKTSFDIAVLLKEHKEETLSTIGSHVFIFTPVQEIWVEADRDKIGHVIHNLINNAVKYAPAGSTIQVDCVPTSGMAMVSVKDEGIGVAPEDKDKLFERYYRVKRGATQAVAGFGIGLYLCAEIIQRHEGKVWVDSELGKGSTFYFTIPAE